MAPVKAETIFIGSAMEDRVRRPASHIVTFSNCSRLDTALDIQPGATRKELERAIKGHVLSQTELKGKYGR